MAVPPVRTSELPLAPSLTDGDSVAVLQQDGATFVLRRYKQPQLKAYLGLADIEARIAALEAGGGGGGGASTFPMTFPITLA